MPTSDSLGLTTASGRRLVVPSWWVLKCHIHRFQAYRASIHQPVGRQRTEPIRSRNRKPQGVAKLFPTEAGGVGTMQSRRHVVPTRAR